MARILPQSGAPGRPPSSLARFMAATEPSAGRWIWRLR